MERLSIDEVIEHCNKTCDMTEKIAKARGHELQSIESKQFWEHYQVREWLKELKKYKDAEEQGLLLRLPCKIGSTLYQPISNRINEYKVIGLCFDITRNEWMYEVAYQIGLEWHKTTCDFDCINKKVFLTKKEAEQALKQMGERENERR